MGTLGHGGDCTGGDAREAGDGGAARGDGYRAAARRAGRLRGMCGRFTQQRPTSEIASIFEAEDLADDPGGAVQRRPHGRGRGRRPARGPAGRRALPLGACPVLGDGPEGGLPKAFNARAETLATSPLFRDPFRRRRCLVPVDGFYEWRREGIGPKADVDPRPVRAPARPGRACGPGARTPRPGEWRRTFTIITTRPNDFMAAIHDRMPVVITPDAWARWLDPAPADPGELRALLEPREDLALDAPRRIAARQQRAQRRAGADRACAGRAGWMTGRPPEPPASVLLGRAPRAAGSGLRRAGGLPAGGPWRRANASAGAIPPSSAAAYRPTSAANSPSSASSGACEHRRLGRQHRRRRAPGGHERPRAGRPRRRRPRPPAGSDDRGDVVGDDEHVERGQVAAARARRRRARGVGRAGDDGTAPGICAGPGSASDVVLAGVGAAADAARWGARDPAARRHARPTARGQGDQEGVACGVVADAAR